MEANTSVYNSFGFMDPASKKPRRPRAECVTSSYTANLIVAHFTLFYLTFQKRKKEKVNTANDLNR